jgi:hypothetical protein
LCGEKKRTNEKLAGVDSPPGQGALESAAGYVAASAGASGASDESGKAFSVAFEALVDWGKASGLIRAKCEFPFFNRPADAAGREHEAWFDELSNRWFKATYPNRFGLSWGTGQTATAGEYLTRLLLQNKYFRDEIRLIALVNWGGRLRVLTSQPHIAGEPADAEQIRRWLADLGFACLANQWGIAWYRKRENLLLADAHEGNVIRSQDGTLVPIDLNIIQPFGHMLDSVLKSLGS